MQISVDALRERLGALLPLRLPLCQLALADLDRPDAVWIDEQGGLRVALLLVNFEGADDDTPRDVKEQELCFGAYAEHSLERWLAYFEGLLHAMPAILEHLGGDPGPLLPSDLVAYWEVLADPSVVSSADFAAALGDPARLAAWDRVRSEEEWGELLGPYGLAGQIEAVRALRRPALRLELERVWEDEDEEDGEQAVVGDSRVGGCPDLPPDLAWPEVEGQPLVFVAQFDLAAVAEHREARELPAHGLLSFFYDPMGDGVRVLHCSDTTMLARREAPEGAEPLGLHTIEFVPETQLPGPASEFFYHALLPVDRVLPWYERLAAGNGADPPIDPSALDRLVSMLADHDGERPIHQLLGCPESIQGDPYLDVEMSTRGGWDGWREGSPEAYQARVQALRWRLLLQIDAVQDGELLLNQDGGFLYFWIPEDALVVHDWSRVRGCLQCH